MLHAIMRSTFHRSGSGQEMGQQQQGAFMGMGGMHFGIIFRGPYQTSNTYNVHDTMQLFHMTELDTHESLMYGLVDSGQAIHIHTSILQTSKWV